MDRTPQEDDWPNTPQLFRVLVVDDQEDQRILIGCTLDTSKLAVSVRTTSNGQDALELAQSEPFHLILLDVMMPDMNGFEVCTRLRANIRTAFIPVIMLTGLADSASREQGFRAGTDDYVLKPFDAADLLTRVERVLERTYGASLSVPDAARRGPAPGAQKTMDG